MMIDKEKMRMRIMVSKHELRMERKVVIGKSPAEASGF